MSDENKSNKVYVVWSADYDSRSIIAILRNKEQAEAYAKRLTQLDVCEWNDYYVDEKYIIDEVSPHLYEKRYHIVSVDSMIENPKESDWVYEMGLYQTREEAEEEVKRRLGEDAEMDALYRYEIREV